MDFACDCEGTEQLRCKEDKMNAIRNSCRMLVKFITGFWKERAEMAGSKREITMRS